MEITLGPSVQTTPTNALIRWSTDQAAGGRVYFGTSVKTMDRRVNSGEVAGRQELRLPGLKPGTTYWYTVGTARLPLATNSFTTPGLGSSVAVGGAPASARRDPSDPAAKPAAIPAAAPPSAAAGKFDASQLRVPPSRQTWGAPRTLQDHYDRHGADFSSRNPDDYAAQAWTFLRRAKAEGLPAKLDEDGVLRVYDPQTRAFAAYNRDLTTRTYFKPGRRDYFDDQPGKPVDLKKLVK